ncbi:MAG: TonB-dependent receptor, partial [Acidobacteria bacterium]|nr:TonB-dependent receptor [Acidobacteriota bacterium]
RVNYANPRQDYGPGGYDQPVADTLSVVYDLPFGHGRHWGNKTGYLTNAALGGWQITLINTMTSGLPINVNYSLSSSSPLYVTDLVTYRPSHAAAGGPITASKSNWVKTATSLNGYLTGANLAIPTSAPWGNVSRNSERSPAFYQADIGLHKAFDLWSESSKFDFRAEAFNVLNKVNYVQPNSTFAVGSTSFGSITTNLPARQLQLAAKVIF